MMTKHLTGKGTRLPLFFSMCILHYEFLSSKFLERSSPHELIFVREPLDLTHMTFLPLEQIATGYREICKFLKRKGRIGFE